jgi:hypothetical protein
MEAAGLPPASEAEASAPEEVRSSLRKDELGPQVGLPRRFGIGTAMLLTALFAVVFATMKTLDTPPALFAGIAVFVAGVAACQAILYRGKNPRKASFVGGYLVGGAIWVAVAVCGIFVWHSKEIGAILAGLFMTVALFGGPLGYLAGGVVAGIFLFWKEEDDAPPETNDTQQPTDEGTGEK